MGPASWPSRKKLAPELTHGRDGRLTQTKYRGHGLRGPHRHRGSLTQPLTRRKQYRVGAGSRGHRDPTQTREVRQGAGDKQLGQTQTEDEARENE